MIQLATNRATRSLPSSQRTQKALIKKEEDGVIMIKGAMKVPTSGRLEKTQGSGFSFGFRVSGIGVRV